MSYNLQLVAVSDSLTSAACPLVVWRSDYAPLWLLVSLHHVLLRQGTIYPCNHTHHGVTCGRIPDALSDLILELGL